MGHCEFELAIVARLGDRELMAGLDGLVAQDRALTARLLVHLAEVDVRGLYRERAFFSMFEYCVEALHMSPDEAYVRLRAAKLAREFPLVLQMLERNELHLSAIKLLAPHLTQGNHAEVLARARSQSKRAVELIVAELAPKHPKGICFAAPDVPGVVRKLPVPRPVVCAASLPAVEPAPAPESTSTVPELRRAAVTTPLSPGRYKVQFTATQALSDKLQQLKDLMRHQIPDGDLSAIVERAVDLLIEQRMKHRFAQTERKPRVAAPAAESSRPASRYIPRSVRRAVHAPQGHLLRGTRDGGQCRFVSPEGRRCQGRGFLELHHDDPYACGGRPTVENLKLMCRSHNALLAEQDFGRGFMRDKLRRARQSLGPGRT